MVTHNLRYAIEYGDRLLMMDRGGIVLDLAGEEKQKAGVDDVLEVDVYKRQDVEMPGMNGVECARAIQDRNPRTILVFATAHEEYMKSAFEVYAFDYLVKPFKLSLIHI